jgi:predicted nucleotidyltransferase component of viral defense system
MFTPNLDILPRSQRRLWTELGDTPKSFVLYGGTALALRLGHRHSEDFDFFSNEDFQPSTLMDTITYLENAEISQAQENTLTAIIDRGGPVKISFFGGLDLNRVRNPDVAGDSGISVASLIDVLATKLKTIQQRAQARDYIDIAAALEAGTDLAFVLAAAQEIYGRQFNGALTLKALTYFEDGDLLTLKAETRNRLREASTSVNLRRLPSVMSKVGIKGDEGIDERP